MFKNLILICIVANTHTFAATYYVSKNGNDTNPGTFSQPWLTLQKATNTLTAGDSVFIRQGIYNERLVPLNSGNVTNYITYMAFPGEDVVLEGINITLPDELAGMIDIRGKGFINVMGFKIQNAKPYDNNAGIFIDSCQFIFLFNNHTYNTVSSGIGIWNSKNIIVENNEVELANNDGEQENISIVNTDSFIISYNRVHNGGPGTNGGEGIDAKWGSSNGKIFGNEVYEQPDDLGIYLDAWNRRTFNIEIYNNIVHDCTEGIDIASEAGGLLENISIYNNIIYNNTYNGITVGNWGDVGVTQRPINNVSIMNNTIYNNGTTGNWGGAILVENPDAKNILIRNNLCSQNFSYQIAISDTVPLISVLTDHNLIDGFRNDAGEIYGADSVVGDPQFVNVSAYDFHLKSSSPAVDNGDGANAPVFDFANLARPIGNGYDIGAYEYALTFINHLHINPANVFIYPNPFSQHLTLQITHIRKGEKHYHFKLLNMLGAEVFNQELTADNEAIKLNLPSGIYFYIINGFEDSTLAKDGNIGLVGNGKLIVK